MLVSNQQLINLGKLKIGHPYRFNYIVRNTSPTDLLKINRLSVGCGSCTQASMDKSLLAAGEEAIVNVAFTPNSTGLNSKSVTIDYDNKHQLKLRFTGEVN